MKKIPLNKTQKRMVREWLKNPIPIDCPFFEEGKIQPHYICDSWFPKVAHPSSWPIDFSCPCAEYSLKHVKIIARKMLEGK